MKIFRKGFEKRSSNLKWISEFRFHAMAPLRYLLCISIVTEWRRQREELFMCLCTNVARRVKSCSCVLDFDTSSYFYIYLDSPFFLNLLLNTIRISITCSLHCVRLCHRQNVVRFIALINSHFRLAASLQIRSNVEGCWHVLLTYLLLPGMWLSSQRRLSTFRDSGRGIQQTRLIDNRLTSFYLLYKNSDGDGIFIPRLRRSKIPIKRFALQYRSSTYVIAHVTMTRICVP